MKNIKRALLQMANWYHFALKAINNISPKYLNQNMKLLGGLHCICKEC